MTVDLKAVVWGVLWGGSRKRASKMEGSRKKPKQAYIKSHKRAAKLSRTSEKWRNTLIKCY